MTKQILRRTTTRKVSLNVAVDPALKAALDTTAHSHGLAAAVVARDALTRGLPLVRKSLRKAARNERGHPEAE